MANTTGATTHSLSAPLPKLGQKDIAERQKRAGALAARYHTQLLIPGTP